MHKVVSINYPLFFSQPNFSQFTRENRKTIYFSWFLEKKFEKRVASSLFQQIISVDG